MPQFKRVRLINPSKRRRNATRRAKAKVSRSRSSARARRKNPLGEELILLSNPRRKRKTNGRRRTNPFAKAASHRRRRRTNPFRAARRARRRNPDGASAKSFAVSGVKAIVAGAVGAVGTRAIVQGVLGDKNTGAIGYLANLAVALGGGYAIFKFTKSYPIAMGWAVGGAANTLQRIWSEKIAMTSPAAAAPQLGDLDYSSNGLGGVGLSGFVNTGFALPSVTDGGGVIQAPFTPNALPSATAAGGSNPGSTVAMVPNAGVSRFQPRY
jgi:hypothetical protein